jgi:hypothetical protein
MWLPIFQSLFIGVTTEDKSRSFVSLVNKRLMSIGSIVVELPLRGTYTDDRQTEVLKKKITK